MKIALVSYEYPPDTALGGIATYAAQIARVLQDRNHQIEVFCSSPYRSCSSKEDEITIHRILSKSPPEFTELVKSKFLERHSTVEFDLVEGPEYTACARGIVELMPDIPFVVKLHTPTFLVREINFIELSLVDKFRWIAGAIRRGHLPKAFPSIDYDVSSDIERIHALEADEIATPSLSLGSQLTDIWKLPPERVAHVPYPYVPSQQLLDIPIETYTNTVTFVGRLEIRKGILDLAKAIPAIIKQCPDTKFRFVGRALNSPNQNLDMQQYLEKKLFRYQNALEFTGGISPDQIPEILAQTDVCIFPSRWENFPNVCLEAMAAGRGVVGSSAGGMAEMLDQNRAGRLIPPHSPEKIAEAVIELIKNPELRMQFGQKARDRVLSEYSLDKIGTLQEAAYQRAIERRQLAGSRIKQV